MKIKHLECWVQEMPLRSSYTIAYETISKCDNIFLKATSDTGITGWGCAAPDKMVTGETTESVISSFKNIIEPLLKDSDPFRYNLLLEVITKQSTIKPSALAMTDMVLHDMIARKCSEPLFKLLGGYRKNMETSITIGILPLEETVSMAQELVKRGFRILKIKGGKNYQEDIDKVIRVREVVGKKIQIRFDANQGYTVEDAVTFISGTKKVGIEVFEQPTNRSREELLGAVTERVPVPVMADESLMTLRDVFRLTRRDLIDMINIKIMKVGGINEAIYINSVAKSAGVESMVGCMDESALGIAAGLHFALSRPNVIYADLDGHLDLENDPFAGLIRINNGILYPDDGPGLGRINI